MDAVIKSVDESAFVDNFFYISFLRNIKHFACASVSFEGVTCDE